MPLSLLAGVDPYFLRLRGDSEEGGWWWIGMAVLSREGV
jgi:hypothetical protein